MRITPDQYIAVLAYATALTLQNPEWRLGQALYNALNRVRPDVAEEIHSTDADPFFDDRKLSRFWTAIS